MMRIRDCSVQCAAQCFIQYSMQSSRLARPMLTERSWATMMIEFANNPSLTGPGPIKQQKNCVHGSKYGKTVADQSQRTSDVMTLLTTDISWKQLSARSCSELQAEYVTLLVPPTPDYAMLTLAKRDDSEPVVVNINSFGILPMLTSNRFGIITMLTSTGSALSHLASTLQS